MKNIKHNLDSLKGTIDIDVFEDALGLDVVKRLGDEDVCRCPLPSHDGYDANPSFTLNRLKLVYNCFACGIGGTLIDLVARMLDVDYEQAYAFCNDYSTKSSVGNFEKKIETIFKEERVVEAKTVLPLFNIVILEDWVNNETDYYSKRNIHSDTKARFALGFDLQHSRGDYTGPAAIIPHFFEQKLVGYQERWTDDDRPSKIPKYTNTKGFPKKETLFAYDEVTDRSPVVVVESALTAVYLTQLGFSSVATFGAQVTDDQIKLLRNFSWGVILAFDNDEAGIAACDRVVGRLHKTIPTHVIDRYGDNKQDLNDLSPSKAIEVIEQAKPWFMRG
jgi:DNA primase